MKKKIFIILLAMIFIQITYSRDKTDDETTKKEKNGWDYYSEGKYQESINALEKEKEMYPNRINIYVIMGWNLKMLKNYAEMEKVSEEGFKIQPTDTRVLRNLGEAYYFQNKYDKTITIFEKYISYRYNWDDPFLPTIYYYLGACFTYTEQYNKADIALSTAKHYKPKDLQVILRLAYVKEKLKNIEKAKELYKYAIKLKPDNNTAKDALKRLNDNQ